jgi:uncharacterized protein YkwD
MTVDVVDPRARSRADTGSAGRSGAWRRAVRAAAVACAFVVGATGAVVVTEVPAGAAVAPGPFTVNMQGREDVRQFFNQVYQSSNGVPDGWSGNVTGCNPGALSPDYVQAMLTRVNYFRTMVGVPPVTFTTANNTEAQAAALLQAANPTILGPDGKPDPHHPTPQNAPTCFTPLGAAGSGASNLFAGLDGVGSVDGWMHDPGDFTSNNNVDLGHRRNMLDPKISQMGAGYIPKSSGFGPTSTLLVLTTPSARPAVRDNFIAWPPRGFVPYQVVYPRWSFSLPGADFSNTTVTMQLAGAAAPVPTTIRPVAPGFGGGEPAISWDVNNLADSASWPKPTSDQTFTVNLTNVVVNGIQQNFTYNVTVFDPSVSDPAHTPQVPQGPVTLPTNQNTTYSVNPVPDASGYQWRSTPVTPITQTDSAQNGLANFTASISNTYNPVQTDVVPPGDTSGFRLSNQDFTPQLLTWNQSLIPSATSQLTFNSRAINLPNMTTRVEVSTDAGTTWVPTSFNQTGGDAAAFTPVTVPLGAFAGQRIQLRFSLTYLFNNGGVFGGNAGWYFDDVSFTGVNSVGAPVQLSAVSPNPSFVFNTPTQSQFLLDVRPQFTNPTFASASNPPGSGFGDWSPTLLVSTAPPPAAPVITTQPQPQTVVTGGNATFTAAATGAPLTFAWSLNGTPLTDGNGIQGSATSTLTVTGVQAAQAGNYTVAVTNPTGTTTSSAAPLVVAPPPAAPVITTQPQPQTVVAGGNATFTAAATGAPLTFAWSLNGTPLVDGNGIQGSATSTLTLTGVQAAQAGNYTVAVTNPTGTTTSSATALVVTAPPAAPVITTQPQPQTVVAGGNATFTAAATGTAPLTFAWSLNGTPLVDGNGIQGSATSTLTLTGVQAAQAGNYTVVVTNPTATTTSTPAALVVNPVATNGLNAALDAPGLTWTTSGDANWFSQTAVTQDGVSAAQSGAIGLNQTSAMQTTITGPATVSFWWRIDSADVNFDSDTLSVAVDGVIQNLIFDFQDWSQATVVIPPGTHVLSFTYSTGSNPPVGAATAWVDQVVVTPG